VVGKRAVGMRFRRRHCLRRDSFRCPLSRNLRGQRRWPVLADLRPSLLYGPLLRLGC